MRELTMQQVPTEPVPGGQPGEGPMEPPAPITDPDEPPPPSGDPDVVDPNTPPDAPMIV